MAGFSYQFGANPTIDFVRLLISDTQECNHVFEDEEILAAHSIQQSVNQSGMWYSGGTGRNLPSTPVSYLRVAALLLDAMSASKSRMASVIRLLDVQLSVDKAAQALRDQADRYRTVDDNSGAFCIIEQCPTSWSFRDRFYKTIQRQVGV